MLKIPSFKAVKRFSNYDREIKPNLYYQPISHQHISVDSLFMDSNGDLNLFQCTAREYHLVMAQSLNDIVWNCDYTNVNLIFVVPAEKHSLPGHRSINNEQTITNNATKLHQQLENDECTRLKNKIKQ